MRKQRRVDRRLSDGEPLRNGLSRRNFLKITGAAAAAASLPGGSSRAASVVDPRIVVVGAGLAGMTAAYEIKRRSGWAASVFEASDHVGGRTRTIRGLAGGQYAEAGGGGISSNEKVIFKLADRLGLRMRDTWKDYPEGKETYYFNGQHYSYPQLGPGLRAISDAASAAWKQIGRRIPSHDDHNAAADAYDNMSVSDFIDTFTDFGPTTPAGSFVIHNHSVEYGGRADVSSSIELILEEGDFWGAGPYDERWAITGGNDRLAKTIAERLPAGSIAFEHQLEAITKLIDDTYRVTFGNPGGTVEVIADHVILAVPATALRSSKVDLAASGISALHMAALDGMVMGTNVKLNLQFDGTPWMATPYNGDATTDTLLGSTWQQSFFRSSPAILVGMNNDDYPSAPAHGVMPMSSLPSTLAAIDVLFPGASEKFIDGQAYLDVWANDPLIGGSYSSTPFGGFTTYGGVEGRREGNIHFAGEHTARYERTGTMAGAVESGIRVARAIVG